MAVLLSSTAAAGAGSAADQAIPFRRGAGSIPSFFKISHTVDAETCTPSPASSPWILR